MISGKFSFILFNLISFCTVCFSQSTVLVGAKTVRLLDVLEATHFLDLPSDSLNTSEIIGNFMGKLDPKSLIFLREDERQLLQYSDSLRIDFKQYSETLVTKTSKLYKKRLLNADSLISALAYQSFNFYEKEILNIDYEHGNNFASTQDSLTVEWGKVLKARILNELIFTAPDSIKELKTQKETLLANLQEVQAKVEKKSKYLLRKILNHPEGFETYIETAWLNAVCSMFDPHTVWFTPDQENQFQESLSAENYGFGINFTDNDDGNIVVDGLSFGSPAWLEKDIETGDFIIGVKPIDKDYIDLTILDSEALAEIINHTSHNRIEFTFRNKNNQNIVKQISKSKIESENIVRSFVLKGSRNIGYLYIPSFYTGFGFSMNNGCSHSVLREMVKLENEGVEGILLDLRGNTGGSLIEAIEIASIFLRDKSIAKLSQRNQPDIFLRTSSQIINCDLPLVILADASSASASELLAGSLEIYNRAIIVGQNTFGKFTGQVILPLNVGMANTSRFNDFSEYGLVKVTTEKTYLANGICYQGRGITPHIQLPFLVDDDQYREAGMPNAIKADTIASFTDFCPDSIIPKETLLTMSKARIARGNHQFGTINKLREKIAFMGTQHKHYNLHIDTLLKMNDEYVAIMKDWELCTKQQSEIFQSSENNFDIETSKKDDYKKMISKRFIETLNKDIYIEECYQVLCDWIELINQK